MPGVITRFGHLFGKSRADGLVQVENGRDDVTITGHLSDLATGHNNKVRNRKTSWNFLTQILSPYSFCMWIIGEEFWCGLFDKIYRYDIFRKYCDKMIDT